MRMDLPRSENDMQEDMKHPRVIETGYSTPRVHDVACIDACNLDIMYQGRIKATTCMITETLL